MKTINKEKNQAITLFGSLLFLLAVTFILTGLYGITTNLF
jgi:hypothetical protein